MLTIFVVSVDCLVEGCILNAVHLVTVIGVHLTSSSLLAVRCASTGRLFCRLGFPS